MDKKLDYISLFKFLAIILVIIGHIPNIPNEIKNYIYSFHMPIFFMIYGFIKYDTIKYKNNSILKNIEKKSKSLMIPYFIWAFIYSGITIISIKAILYGSHIALKEYSNSSLWFLPTYYVSVMLFDIYQLTVSKLRIKEHIYFCDIIAIMLFFIIGYLIPNYKYGIVWGGDISLIGVSLMILGKNIRILYNKFNSNRIKNLIIVLVASIGILIYKFNSIEYMLLAEKNIGNPFIFTIVSTMGFILILSLSRLLEDINNKIKNYFIYIGNNTLIFFVMQRLVIGFVNKVINKIPFIHYYISVILVIIFTAILLYFIAVLINRYIPELNGKTERTN